MTDKKQDFSTVMDQLKDMKNKEQDKWNEDVIKRTISSLLAIEKKAMYGSLRGKAKLMDKVIQTEMKNSKGVNSVTQRN